MCHICLTPFVFAGIRIIIPEDLSVVVMSFCVTAVCAMKPNGA